MLVLHKGKLCSSELSIRSTFQQPIHVTSINFTDAGLRFEDFNPKGSKIAPDAVTKVGRIYFEPAQLCQNRCYIPLDEKGNSLAFPTPLDTKGGRNNNFHFDETELRRRTELFRHLKWYFQTISFTLNSREVHQFPLQLIIDIEWPKLVVDRHPAVTVEVGKVQQIPVVITNPAERAILVDYFLSDPQYARETQLSLPLEVIDISSNCFLTDKAVFSLPENSPPLPVLVPARTSIVVPVQFEAHDPDTYCTLLHIRNNLTLYEAVWMSAKTVQSQFRFGNRKPGSKTPLLFEINEKHLAACARSHENAGEKSQSLITTKRTFTARNTGEIPIWVETFLIGDQQCEGFGFKVIDCNGFELKANASKKIDIAFSPDFTAARVSRPLVLKTNLSYDINYTLVAQLPPVSLDECSGLLPRPPWEESMRNVAVVVLTTTFVFVLIAAHIDYGNILITQSALYMSRERGPVHPTFNLRNIAMKTATTEEEQQSSLTSQQRTNPRTSCQQKGAASSNANGSSSSFTSHLKKRAIKKLNSSTSDGGRRISLLGMSWPRGFNSLKEAAPSKQAQPTFSERNYRLRAEAEKVTAQSSNSSSSSSSCCEHISKSALKVSQTDKEAVTANGGVKKQQQRALKKSKNVLQAPNEKAETEERQKVGNKYGKPKEEPIVTATKTATETAKSNPEGLTPSDASFQRKQTPPAAKEPSYTRKYGKTPGRERKKENQQTCDASNNSTTSSLSSNSSSCASSKRSAQKQKNKAVSALSFNDVATTNGGSVDRTAMNSITSPWETSSQVSFSDVLQLPNNLVDTVQRSSVESAVGLKEFKQKTEPEHSLLDIDLNRKLNSKAFAVASTSTLVEKTGASNSSTELGPIGSRKSPSSTPVSSVWESVINSNANVSALQQLSKPTLSNNSSFFSNLLPAYDYDERQPLVGASPDLYELKKMQEELQRQWQTNEYILNLRQQQLQVQQQLMQNVDTANNWGGLNASTWTPMGYGQNAGNIGNVPPAGAVQRGGGWQNAHTVRPPPGLEANYQNVAQPQQQMTPNNDIASQPNSANMQTFDPFSSLSSIWADNWNKNQHQHSPSE